MDENFADQLSTEAQEERDFLSKAESRGFEIIKNASQVTITKVAAQALPNSKILVPINVEDGYLIAVTNVFPSAQEFQSDTETAGMPISIMVAPKAVYEQLRTRYEEYLGEFKEEIKIKEHSIVTDVFDMAIQSNTSDLHISVGSEPRIRKGAKLISLPMSRVLVAEDIDKWVEFLIGPHALEDNADKPFDSDKTITYGGYRWRVSGFKQRNSYAFSLRRINPVPMSITELGLPSVLVDLCDLPSGLIVFSGATNSGKSTSCAAMIDRINEMHYKHIISIEDPVEYQHTNKKSLIQQREVGKDTVSFNKALKHILRQDPDVILVGEMRDHETISTVLTAAETGHLVITTLHAQSAGGVIDRIIDVFPPEQQAQIRTQLANTLRAVVAQSLLPSARNDASRELVSEILHVTPPISTLIRESKVHQLESSMESGPDSTHKSKIWDKALAEAFVANKITERTARDNIRHTETFNTYLKRLNASKEAFLNEF